MVVALAVWKLHLPGCSSLKEKRQVLRSVKDRLHRQFNVAVAETAYHDVWQTAEVGACTVAVDRRQAERVLHSADALVEGEARARIVESFTIFY